MKIENFLKNLHGWYRKNGRHDMPWRKTSDPYAILLSEFMLQQTTVSTVKPYYERFLKKFPTLASLANADLNEVLALWSGLGYYARARNLWAAAQTIQKKHRGKIPSTVDELIKLPGIGFYTAGAISSIAFNKPAAVLDGNIIRVMMRTLAIEEEPKLKAVQAVLRKSLLDLTEAARQGGLKTSPREVVLALFDLGATVCLPQNPDCGGCPIQSDCLAYKYGRQNEIPPAKERIERPIERHLRAVVDFKGKWLMGQRPKEGLFGGLWDFVGTELIAGENPVLFLEDAVREETGVRIQVVQAIPAFEHQLTHKIMIIRPYKAKVRGTPRKSPALPSKGAHYERFRWVGPRDLRKFGISSITQRIINTLLAPSS